MQLLLVMSVLGLQYLLKFQIHLHQSSFIVVKTSSDVMSLRNVHEQQNTQFTK